MALFLPPSGIARHAEQGGDSYALALEAVPLVSAVLGVEFLGAALRPFEPQSIAGLPELVLEPHADLDPHVAVMGRDVA